MKILRLSFLFLAGGAASTIPGALAADFRQSAYVAPPASIDMQKLQTEEWIRGRVSSALEVFLPQDKFFVNVKISFKGSSSQKPQALNLSAIDSVVPIYRRETGDIANAWATQISSVAITVAMDRQIPLENIAGITDLAKSMVPFIAASRIKVGVVQLIGEPLTYEKWFRENQTSILMAFMAMLLGGLLVGYRRNANQTAPIYVHTAPMANSPATPASHAVTPPTGTRGEDAKKEDRFTKPVVPDPPSRKMPPVKASIMPEIIDVEIASESKPRIYELKAYPVQDAFPENEILSIPKQLAAPAFLALSPATKVGLLAVMSNRAREQFLKNATTADSKLRSFLEIEVKNCLNDGERIRYHQQEQHALAKFFAHECRELLQKRPEMKEGLPEDIEFWIFNASATRDESAA